MAIREGKRETLIDELVCKLCSAIRCMPEGSQDTIGSMVSKIYAACGYEYRWLDPMNNYGWTKDNCRSYILTQEDLFDVMDELDIALGGDVFLDYGTYDNMDAGFPFSLSLSIRKTETRKTIL